MEIFSDPTLKLKLIGRLKTRSAKEMESSSISIGFETLDRELFKPEACYDLLAETGAKWARCQTGWNRCEKTKGIYDFNWLDTVVDELLKRGVQPWFNLGFGNKLYIPDAPNEAAVGCVPLYFGEECLKAWKNFVSALVKHFCDRIRHWEIWNEPNIDCFWWPTAASGRNYAELIAVTVPVIKAVDSKAIIVGCCSSIDCGFVLDALKNGMGRYIDRFAVHPYQAIPEQDLFSRVRNMQRLFRKYAPQVKIWQGECGYPSQTYGHHDTGLGLYHADEETQAKYVIRRITLDSMLNLELRAYFHITDFMEKTYYQADGKDRPPVILGLTHGRTYTPKKSWYALRNIAAVFDKDTVAEDLYATVRVENYDLRQSGALPLLSPIVGTFVRRGCPLYTYYCPEDLQNKWVGRPHVQFTGMRETDGPMTRPVLIDPLTGTVYEATAVKTWERSEVDYFEIHELPMTDYPLILTDQNAVDILEPDGTAASE